MPIASGGGGSVGFEDLEVWQQAHELVLEIYRATEDFPNTERFRLTDQLCRASSSIPTNVAEGTGRYGKRDFKHFLYIARGSLEETKYLLLLGKDLGFLGHEDYNRLRDRCKILGKLLNGLINSLKKEE
jgi:four helix bundle protein